MNQKVHFSEYPSDWILRSYESLEGFAVPWLGISNPRPFGVGIEDFSYESMYPAACFDHWTSCLLLCKVVNWQYM